MAPWTLALSAPGLVMTSMVSNWPTSSEICCAVGRSKAARVIPASVLAVPYWAMPEMVKVRSGPSVRTRTCWPTRKWYFLAVAASMTTSWDVVGGPPSTMRSSEILELGSKLTPRLPSALLEMGFPSGATNWA